MRQKQPSLKILPIQKRNQIMVGLQKQPPKQVKIATVILKPAVRPDRVADLLLAAAMEADLPGAAEEAASLVEAALHSEVEEAAAPPSKKAGDLPAVPVQQVQAAH